MYDELVKRVRQIAEEVCDDYDVDPYDAEQRCFVIEEAADAIEELSKLHETQKRNLSVLTDELMRRWIPVTERLPEEGEFVLVYGDLYPNKHDGGVIAVSKRMDWNYWQGLGRERNITHWMPLPKGPKED